MDITIYGKEECEKCSTAKDVLPDVASYDHSALYDHFGLDRANEIVVASNGNLPIIILKTAFGVLQLGVAGSTVACKDGSCSIGEPT